MTTILNESFFTVRPDDSYRRQGRHIVIASLASLIPYEAVVDPSVWGVGNSEYTWGRVQKFFARLPAARRNQMPMHFYSEYLYDDYVSYVGCPLSNRSWFLQQAVAAGVLGIEYVDAILVVTQENWGVEAVEKRLWQLLAHNVVTPLMRLFDVPRNRVVFFENLASRTAVNGPDWNYRFREPTYLDPVVFDLFLKDYEKR